MIAAQMQYIATSGKMLVWFAQAGPFHSFRESHKNIDQLFVRGHCIEEYAFVLYYDVVLCTEIAGNSVDKHFNCIRDHGLLRE